MEDFLPNQRGFDFARNGVGSKVSVLRLAADRLGQVQKSAEFNWIVISSALQVNLSSCCR